MMEKIFRYFLIIFSFAFAVFVFFFQLGKNSLIEFDEGIYALVARRMAESGDLLNLTWREDVPWFDKGPFYFWLTAPLLKVFGFEALPVRFWSAFLGLLTVAGVFLIGKKLMDDYAGVLAAVVLSSTIGFVYYARLGMLDVPNAFFNTMSVLFLIYSRENRKFLYLAAAVLGLGFLNRGFLVMLGSLSYLIYVLIFERGGLRVGKEAIIFLTVFLFAAGT